MSIYPPEEPHDAVRIQQIHGASLWILTRVAEVCEPESYAEPAKDANWRDAMEEEMHVFAGNEI